MTSSTRAKLAMMSPLCKAMMSYKYINDYIVHFFVVESLDNAGDLYPPTYHVILS